MRLSIVFWNDDIVGEYDFDALNIQMTTAVDSENLIKINVPLSHLHSSTLLRIFQMHLPRLLSACKQFKLEFNLANDEDLEHFMQQPHIVEYIYQLFQSAEHLTRLHFIFKAKNKQNNPAIFENFVRACHMLPNKSRIQELLISTKDLEIAQRMNSFSHGLCDGFLNFIAELGHLRVFSFHGHDVPCVVQKRLHHLIEKMPHLHMLELQYHQGLFDLYSFAKVLKNQRLNLLYLECSGIWHNMQGDYTVSQSWQAVQQALRSNHHLQRVTFNLFDVLDPSYDGLDSTASQSYFSTHFLETLKILGQLTRLEVLQICMPRFIADDLVNIEKQISLIRCFEHIRHIKFVNLDCLFMPLGEMLQRFSRRLNHKHLSYKPEMRQFFELHSPLRQKSIADEDISDFYRIKAKDILRLDMELCQFVAPFIANTEPPQNEGNQVLVQRFATDLMKNTFPRHEQIFEGIEHIGLNILKFLDAKTMARMVLANGGIHAHLKRQIFDSVHRVPEVLENGPHSPTSFFLGSRLVNLLHEYTPQEMTSILISRFARVAAVKVLPVLNFDGQMIENYLATILLPSLSSQEILVLPIYVPGHWLGLIIDSRMMNNCRVYCFDSLPKQARTDAILQRLMPGLPSKFSVFLHQHGLIVNNPYDSGCFLIENITSFLTTSQMLSFLSLDMRCEHGRLLVNNPAFEDSKAINSSMKPRQLAQLSTEKILSTTKLINVDGSINLFHHYTAKDMKVILTHRLNYFPMVKILNPLNFETSGFAYTLHHFLLASTRAWQKLVMPIETGSHWLGIVIERKDSSRAMITLHDSLPNRKRAQIILEKVVPLVKKAWNIEVEWRFAIGDWVETEVNSCGAFLIENIVKNLDVAATLPKADAVSIRQSHVALIAREQPTYLMPPPAENNAPQKRMCFRNF